MPETEMTPQEKARERYEELFPDTESKAAAFDKLAEMYYMCNFGTAAKADVDLLMFSEYADSVLALEKGNVNSPEFSDYTISKSLGITQSRISSLKERKQLKYPYKNFDWRESFKEISKNARYENGKVIFSIPDRNLYLEIKNAIEKNNGYIETQLNQKLLQIPVEYFLDLLVVIDGGGNDEKKKIEKELRKQLNKEEETAEYIENDPIEILLDGQPVEVVVDIIENVVSGDFVGVAKDVLNNVLPVIKRAIKSI